MFGHDRPFLRFFLSRSFFIFLSCLWLFCSDTHEIKSDLLKEKPFKLGLLIPLTGPEAVYGLEIKRAVSLAVEDAHAKGGINGQSIMIAQADDACASQAAAIAAASLVDAGVEAVFGGYCSGAVLPALKIFAASGIPFVTPASFSPKLHKANKGNVFFINDNGLENSEPVSKFLLGQGIRKLAIIHQDDGYSEELAWQVKRIWEQSGHLVAAMENAGRGGNYDYIAARLKAASPDAIFWTGYHANGAMLLVHLRKTGYSKPFIVTDGSINQRFLELAGAFAQGVYALSFRINEHMPGVPDFLDRYRNKYNAEPGSSAASSYNGARLILAAAARKNSFPNYSAQESLISALKTTEGFIGLGKEISFNENNVSTQDNFAVLLAKDGKWILAKPSN